MQSYIDWRPEGKDESKGRTAEELKVTPCDWLFGKPTHGDARDPAAAQAGPPGP